MSVAAVTVMTLPLTAACGGGEDDAAPAGGTSANAPVKIRVANTSPTQPNFVPTKYGVMTYGKDFGLDMTLQDFTTFDSHSVATQTVLSGKADVVAGSFVSDLVLVDKGQKFKAFCPYISQDDFVIAGANGVTSIPQLFEPGRRVALDSPGGAGEVILNAILQASGETRTAKDIPGAQILESSGLRTSAFAAGDVDATVIHKPQYDEAASSTEDAVIIASLYEKVPVFVKEVHAAPASWLDQNKDAAARYCAAVLKGMRDLEGNYELFTQAVDQYAESKPEDPKQLEEIHRLAQQYGFWPGMDGGLDEESVAFMANVAVKSGLIEKAPAYGDVVDREVLDRALQLVNEKS